MNCEKFSWQFFLQIPDPSIKRFLCAHSHYFYFPSFTLKIYNFAIRNIVIILAVLKFKLLPIFLKQLYPQFKCVFYLLLGNWFHQEIQRLSFKQLLCIGGLPGYVNDLHSPVLHFVSDKITHLYPCHFKQFYVKEQNIKMASLLQELTQFFTCVPYLGIHFYFVLLRI